MGLNITRDFAGVEFEFYSATFQRGSIPDAYHIFISGINENGYTTVAYDFVNMNETNRVKAIQNMGFYITRESVEEFRKYSIDDCNGMTLVVRRRPHP